MTAEFAAPKPKLDKLALLGEISERCYELQQQASGGHHEPGTGAPADEVLAQWQHREIAQLHAKGSATWKDELRDSTAAVYAAHGWAELREALIGTAGLLVCWLLDADQAALKAGDVVIDERDPACRKIFDGGDFRPVTRLENALVEAVLAARRDLAEAQSALEAALVHQGTSR